MRLNCSSRIVADQFNRLTFNEKNIKPHLAAGLRRSVFPINIAIEANSNGIAQMARAKENFGQGYLRHLTHHCQKRVLL